MDSLKQTLPSSSVITGPHAILPVPALTEQTGSAADLPPIFQNVQAIQSSPCRTSKSGFEKAFSSRTIQITKRSGSRSIHFLNDKKSSQSVYNIQNHNNTGVVGYSEEYLQKVLQMPQGISQSKHLIALMTTGNLTKEWEFKYLLAVYPNNIQEEMIEVFDKRNKGLLITWAQDTSKDANFRAQCLLHAIGNVMRKQTRETLLKELIERPKLDLEHQVDLSLLLDNGPLKKEHLKRLAKNLHLGPKHRTKCIFYFPPGKVKDELIVSYVETPDIDLNLKVPAIAFVKDDTLRNQLLINFYHQEPDNLHARSYCVVCMDACDEKAGMRAELEQIPEASRELAQIDSVLQYYYPSIKDLDSLSIGQKIKALYQDPSYLVIYNDTAKS